MITSGLVNVFTHDIEKALAFYGGVLGLSVGARYGRMPGIEFETGNLTLSIIDPSKMNFAFRANTNPVALHVEPDVASLREELEGKGVAFQGETFDTGVCHMAFFADPDGNALMLHHRYAPRTPEG